MTEYSAIILAGGKSSRMGQKKGTLLYNGKTFIEIIIDKLKELKVSEILISGYEYPDDSIVYVEDVFLNKGPLAGIHSGLIKTTCQAAIVLTEDAPLVPVHFIRRLMEEHDKTSASIVVASYEDRLQPFPGIYDKSLVPICENVLQGDRHNVMALIENVGCVSVPFDGDEKLIRGCNTPEEYAELIG